MLNMYLTTFEESSSCISDAKCSMNSLLDISNKVEMHLCTTRTRAKASVFRCTVLSLPYYVVLFHASYRPLPVQNQDQPTINYETNCRASSTAHLAARFNSLFHSVSRHRDQVVNPSGG